MAESNDTPIQSVHADAPIKSVQTGESNGLVREGYQPVERKGYQPQTEPHRSSPPQSIGGLIPVNSTTQSAQTGTPPAAPVQPQSSTTIPAASEKTE
jgi:hypothetical protein